MTKAFLGLVSSNARLALVTGLIAGLAMPKLAALLQPRLPQMVAILLVITALRVGPLAVRGALSDLRWSIASVAVLQLLLPLSVIAVCSLAGLLNSPFATAVILATAAPALSGSPNLALLLGQDAGRMMQILVLGTALFPVTVLPVLALLPDLASPAAVFGAAAKLLVVILSATALGFGLRVWFFRNPNAETMKALDGLSVLAFSAIVVGLMAALNPALSADPWQVLRWAMLAFGLCYGLQILIRLMLRNSLLHAVSGPLAIGAGNRNIALFLVALPPETLAPLMVFVGCWQLPMYLTPILLRRLYEKEF